jgi:hypothetical protein
MQDAPTLTAGDVVDAGDRQPGDWLPPAAAASRLGVSERTLWRLVKAGRYHRRVADRKAMILVPTTAPPPDTSATSGSPIVPDTVTRELSGNLSGVTDSAVSAIVGELRRQHESSLALIAQQAETIGRLTAENEALKAAQGALEAPGLTEPPDPTTEGSVPWWRSWWRW